MTILETLKTDALARLDAAELEGFAIWFIDAVRSAIPHAAISRSTLYVGIEAEFVDEIRSIGDAKTALSSWIDRVIEELQPQT